MQTTVYDRLLRREIGTRSPYSSIQGIHGDKHWVDELDIINELEGHTGCVNALSWSKNGRFLASGSDDQYLNIYAFQPDDSLKSFSLATTVSTGHTANIFSVKFMPHSNDRTLVTAAGDAEIRVFDIEHSVRSSSATDVRAQGCLNQGVRYLNHPDANCRVYRSHGDRVKRIVTESSPHLFLSCSEDGEVRQWDLRQPSSAYPRPRTSIGALGVGRASSDGADIPPPLISYKQWHMDINTISCSPSQPHYIALGGAHLHCFLHDRRMIGRDLLSERGAAPRDITSEHDDELMSQATRCVRRFAPNGQRQMKRTESGHITACKISDANPNELVASWSGDWIYSFDLIRSPDARDSIVDSPGTQSQKSRRAKESRERKRKRTTREGPTASVELNTERRVSKQRKPQIRTRGQQEDEVALRVRYQNGQSENIPLQRDREISPSAEDDVGIVSEAQKRSNRIANACVKIRKCTFNLGELKGSGSQSDPTGHASSFTTALGFSASVLDDMDDIMQNWSYPVNPNELDVVYQKTLRRNRQSARRFVQAAGTLARLLGGRMRTAGSNSHVILDVFSEIVPTPNEVEIQNDHERFSYDFLKAIVLWLTSGPSALVDGFTESKGTWRTKERFPIPDGESIEAIDEILIPHLLALADKRRIPDVDASRFEVDANRSVFESEKAAVISFSRAIKIPFEDLFEYGEGHESMPDASVSPWQPRHKALRFWGFKVARGVLLNAGHGVNHSFVERAFGGLGQPQMSSTALEEERILEEQMRDVDPDEDEEPITAIDLLVRAGSQTSNDYEAMTSAAQATPMGAAIDEQDSNVDEVMPNEVTRDALSTTDQIQVEQAFQEAAEESDRDDDDFELEEDGKDGTDEDSNFAEEEDEDGEEDDGEEDDDDDDDEDEDEAGEEEGDDDIYGLRREQFIWRSPYGHSAMRENVQSQVPCSPHMRVYRGHCNVKTVKDVNFYGPNDEYVVSGSDSGHVFIWDKKTSQIVNILEGDGEVVNVVQGHPYEPMLAVSGIDSTIKIFSADSRARRNARRGIGITQVDPSGFSSIRHNSIFRRSVRSQSAVSTPAASVQQAKDNEQDDGDSESDADPPLGSNGLSSRKRMRDEYQITSQNDNARRGGNREAFITRSMLAQIAARMRIHPAGAATGGTTGQDSRHEDGMGEYDEDDEDDEGYPLTLTGPGGHIVVSDDCQIM